MRVLIFGCDYDEHIHDVCTMKVYMVMGRVYHGYVRCVCMLVIYISDVCV